MKSTIANSVSCISVLVLFAGYGSAPAEMPAHKTPASRTVSSSLAVSVSNLLAKPALYSQINPGNPLSQGLVSLVALNEGIGNSFYDAATGREYHAARLSGTPADALPPTWFAPIPSVDYPWEAPALANNGGTAQAIASNLPPSQFISANSTGYSYAVLLQPLDTTTFGRVLDAAGAAVVTIYLNIPGGEGTVSTTWRNAAGTSTNPKYSFAHNKWILVLCTVKQGMGVMYVNGVEVAHDATVNLARSVANQTGSLVYNATGNGSTVPNANLSSWWIWNNRVLTAQEAAEMYENPWAMLK